MKEKKLFDAILSILEEGAFSTDEVRVFFLLFHYPKSGTGKGCRKDEIETLLNMTKRQVNKALRTLINKGYVFEQYYPKGIPYTYVPSIPDVLTDSTSTKGREDIIAALHDIPFPPMKGITKER